MKSNFFVDESLCTACGKCIKECGHHVEIENKNECHINPGNLKCISCYHCYTVCPNNAIKIDNYDNLPIFNEELFKTINEENLTCFLSYRRSIRSFQIRSIDDAVVEKLIDRARYIPSGGNAHSYEFSVIKSEATKKNIKQELHQIYKKRSDIINSLILRNIIKPFVNVQMREFLEDNGYRGRIKKLIERICKGDDPFFYNAPTIVIIHSKSSIPTPKEDCILAGYNIILMAQTLGLGSCFVTLAQNAINSSTKCKIILNLTSYDNVNAVIVLGYPKIQHMRVAPKPEKEIHWC